MTIFRIKRSGCQATMGVRNVGGSVIVDEYHCELPLHHRPPHRARGLFWGATAEEMMKAAQEEEAKSRIIVGGK